MPETNLRYFSPDTDPKIDWGRVNLVALQQLNLARHVAGIPFRITSHYRSPDHSVAVGGSATDAHTEDPCGAFDIAFSNTEEAFRIVKGLVFAGFKRIGINKKNRHVHADTSHNLPTPRLWIE